MCQNVRVWYEESWVDANGNSLPLSQCGGSSGNNSGSGGGNNNSGGSGSGGRGASPKANHNQEYKIIPIDNETRSSGCGSAAIINLTNMGAMFSHCTGLTNLQGLEDWDISSVSELQSMFGHCSGLTSLQALSDWTTTSVRSMTGLFYDCSSLTSLSPISSWNTGSVQFMEQMFYGCMGLTNLSALSGWNVSSVIFTGTTESKNGFFKMFYVCNGVHPTWTNRSGTWFDGTFTPPT